MLFGPLPSSDFSDRKKKKKVVEQIAAAEDGRNYHTVQKVSSHTSIPTLSDHHRDLKTSLTSVISSTAHRQGFLPSMSVNYCTCYMQLWPGVLLSAIYYYTSCAIYYLVLITLSSSRISIFVLSLWLYRRINACMREKDTSLVSKEQWLETYALLPWQYYFIRYLFLALYAGKCNYLRESCVFWFFLPNLKAIIPPVTFTV